MKCPWTSRLFNKCNYSKQLNQQKQEIFHTHVMKCMFLAKRGKPDVLTGVSALSTRVLTPNEDYWNKLTRLLSYLKSTIKIVLLLEADDIQELKWYVDASFGTHSDLKSYTGSVFTLGNGAICSDSSKQKVNARSSTEAELISINDKIATIMWMNRFIESQGFHINLNVIYQDNTRTIKLAKNGKNSSGKRTQHFDIKYFYITDLINRKEVSIKYCSSNDMLTDYHSKPLIREKFMKIKNKIVNII